MVQVNGHSQSSFRHFRGLIPLFGVGYDDVIRALYRHILGAALLGIVEDVDNPANTRLANPIWMGSNYEDSRVPVLFVMPSASGKQELIVAIQLSCTPGIRFSPVTSWFSEQFVGTTRWADERRKTGKTDVRGLMDDHHVVLDEVERSLMTHDTESQTLRDYMKKGLNPFGKNMVYKRRTEFRYAERLEYFPRMSPAYFTKPGPIPWDLFTDGFIRRMDLAYLAATFEQRLDGFSQSFQRLEGDVGRGWNEWRAYLEFLRSRAPYVTWNVTHDLGGFIEQNVTRIAKDTVTSSPQLDEFVGIMLHPLKWRVAKFACICAAERRWWSAPRVAAPNGMREYIDVTVEDGRLAIADVEKSWEHTLALMRDWVRIDTHRAPIAPAADVRQVRRGDVRQVLIDVLCDAKAFTSETGVSAKDLLEKASDQLAVPLETVRNYYVALKKDGILSFRRLASKKTSVYLSDPVICQRHTPDAQSPTRAQLSSVNQPSASVAVDSFEP